MKLLTETLVLIRHRRSIIGIIISSMLLALLHIIANNLHFASYITISSLGISIPLSLYLYSLKDKSKRTDIIFISIQIIHLLQSYIIMTVNNMSSYFCIFLNIMAIYIIIDNIISLKLAYYISILNILIILIIGHKYGHFHILGLSIFYICFLSLVLVSLRRRLSLQTLSDITNNKLEKIAYKDELTNLLNRRGILEHLDKTVSSATRSHGMALIILLDLDNFKNVNDTLGHEAGDILLKEIASILNQAFRQYDSIGRLGGDEFLIIINDDKCVINANIIATKLLETFHKHLHQYKDLDVTASIGISIFPQDSLISSTLLKKADIAMYYAKAHGKNRFEFYNKGMSDG